MQSTAVALPSSATQGIAGTKLLGLRAARPRAPYFRSRIDRTGGACLRKRWCCCAIESFLRRFEPRPAGQLEPYVFPFRMDRTLLYDRDLREKRINTAGPAIVSIRSPFGTMFGYSSAAAPNRQDRFVIFVAS